MNNFLFRQIDNTGLVLFRVVFGLLISIEAFGAIATGWVRRVLAEPEFTFNFIGFDFLQSLQGPGMYYYFVIMGLFGIMIMLGYRYRLSMFMYALMWTGVYFMQKSAYNNHYYLMMLLCWIMVFLPANRWLSIDANMNPSKKTSMMANWCRWVMILQVLIVFTYASVAKWYPDWLDATAPALFMKAKKGYWIIGDMLQQPWVHYSIAYFGIFFDLIIIPMLLWKKTRMMGFYLSLFFHLFNSIVFQVGIFPYMSISFALFFFSSETLKKRFLPKKEIYTGNEVIIPRYRNILIPVFTIYFIFQIGLPLRHWVITDDVLWTEEGHRLSWRMMLRSKKGTLTVWVEDKTTGERKSFDYRKILSRKQTRNLLTHPDFMWQLAQYLKEEERNKGNDVAIYMNSKVSVNGGPYFRFIEPKTDLAAVRWDHFRHHDWILQSPEDYHQKNDRSVPYQ
jgi:hypothetical protein